MLQTTISPLKRLLASPLQFRDYLAVESLIDSVRAEVREGENRPAGWLGNDLSVKRN
jgi:hypothetical protein